MRSVRTRITLTAALVTAIALAVAAVLLLNGLRSSLTDQLDDSISDQAFDYGVSIVDYATLETAASLNDIDTLLVILDETGGEPWLANDLGVTTEEIIAEVPLQDALFSDGPLLVDASIQSATETPGAESMRAAVEPLVLDDQPDDEPIIYVFVGRSTRPIDDTVASTRNQLLLLLPALVGLVAALAWWLTGRALQPVAAMRRQVDDISAGDMRRRVSEPGSADEIDELAATMNRMLGRLEDSSVQQQRFVSDAAHELRTPLASIAAQLDVDAAHPDGADHQSTAGAVRHEVTRMQSLIDGLLALARADQGAEHSPRRLLDLDEIVRQSAGRVPKPERVALDLARLAPVEVRGDADALLRVIDNLLANAYRHARSSVSAAAGQDADGVWCTIDDDGDGVPGESRELIFDRFVRLDEARSRDRGGSGLGLAVSREIAAAHGGSLSVSEGHLGGASFVLRLPAA